MGAVLGMVIDHAGVDIPVQPAAAHPQKHNGGQEHGKGGGCAGEKEHGHLQDAGEEEHGQLLRPPLKQGVDQQRQHVAHVEHAAQQALRRTGQCECLHDLVEQHAADGVHKGVEERYDQNGGRNTLHCGRAGVGFHEISPFDKKNRRRGTRSRFFFK